MYGNETFTMSQGSNVGIGLLVGLRSLFLEGGERVVDGTAVCLSQDDAVALNAVDEFIALSKMQRGSYRRWNCSLCLAGQLAGNHATLAVIVVRKFLIAFNPPCHPANANASRN